MDEALTTGRQTIRANTQEAIDKIIQNYDMGILVVDVNFQSARPPEAVKDAFDDAIAAREDEERFVREAEAYSNDILPKATGRAERLKKEAEGYSEKVINGALGEVAQFEKLLPEYLAAQEVTRNRLYLETMERVYGNTSKVMIDSNSSGNLLYLPLDKLINPSEQNGKPESSTSSGSYGIELEKVETAPVTTSPRGDSGRQGRY
jgi:membrane protease subunit HflK